MDDFFLSAQWDNTTPVNALSHTHVRVMVKGALTILRKMCVRRRGLSSLPVACTTFAHVCTRKSCEKTNVALKESVDITLSTNCDLANECLGVRAIESLGVRVATIVVKMMKREVATSSFYNFGSAIPGLLAMLHRMAFAVLSRSSE